MFPEYTKVCPEGVYQLELTVSQSQTDALGRMRIGDMARQMQVITEKHLNQYAGLSFDTLKAKGKGWIIAWTAIDIKRRPKLGEAIQARIWSGKNGSAMFLRKYAFYTGDGEPLMTAASYFFLMDHETRSITGAPDQMKNMKAVTVPGEPLPPEKRMSFPSEYRNQVKRVAKAEEIDFNGHLNNSHYLDWTEDLIDEDYYASHELEKIWIRYSKEILEGQTVRLQYIWDGDVMMMKGSTAGKEAFLLKVDFS